MKINFLSHLLCRSLFTAASLVSVSCSPESENGSMQDPQSQNNHQHRAGSAAPYNDRNDFDLAGQIHNELLSIYYEHLPLPGTTAAIAERVEGIAGHNSAFMSLKPVTYSPVTGPGLDAMLDPSYGVSQAIGASRLTPVAKESLLGFVSTLIGYVAQDERFEVIYEFAISYEASVSVNPLLNEHDKEVILTTASIARHSAHFRKKRPKKNTDPDWDWLTANIIGGTEGANYGTAEAITYALAGGIAENRQ